MKQWKLYIVEHRQWSDELEFLTHENEDHQDEAVISYIRYGTYYYKEMLRIYFFIGYRHTIDK